VSQSTVLKVGMTVGLLNCLAFMLSMLVLGGSAVLGYALDGHYYLEAGRHLVQVSGAVFFYSKWQAYSLIATLPMGLACAWRWSELPISSRSEAAASADAGGVTTSRLVWIADTIIQADRVPMNNGQYIVKIS
jgi:hypothetical protein